jgi:6-phosphogluconate dehydrogenase
LEAALLTSFIAVFIQGFELIGGAAAAHGWAVERAAVARLWRAGCIVRARLLDELVPALERAHPERLLLADAALRARLSAGMPALRATVMAGARGGIPVPAFASALAWLDGSATARLPADLIQAQRDRFGAHGFDRLDRPGRHHHAWAGSARR